jgi:hypothetical protein
MAVWSAIPSAGELSYGQAGGRIRNPPRAFVLKPHSAEKERQEFLKLSDDRASVDAVMAERFRDAEAFMRILQVTAEGKVPSRPDLDVLTEALNVPLQPLFYFPQGVARKCGRSPYDAKRSNVRQAAEALLIYLNLTDACGPVHAACRVCKRLMIRKRGGRKYCSAACSKTAWNYEARKEKLSEHYKLKRKIEKQLPRKGV